jgi:gluconate 2-dehydrogenase gamma chain
MSERPEFSSRMSDISRRDLLRNIAAAVTVVGTGTLDPQAAKHVHGEVGKEKKSEGAYTPKCFNPHEYSTLSTLTEIIIPTDDQSGGAQEAGAPEFIDLLSSQNEELANIFIGGILWLDRQMQRRYSTSFLAASKAQQTEMLDLLAKATDEKKEIPAYEVAEEYRGFQDYRGKPPSPLAAGTRFFQWTRRMTVDAFYTSPIGIKDVGFKGNGYSTEYVVPKESIQYALKRSPFGSN